MDYLDSARRYRASLSDAVAQEVMTHFITLSEDRNITMRLFHQISEMSNGISRMRVARVLADFRNWEYLNSPVSNG